MRTASTGQTQNRVGSREGLAQTLPFAGVMKTGITVSVLAVLIGTTLFAQTGDASGFTPARRLSGSTPSLPSPNTIGSIEESLDLTVDATGHVRGVTAAQATAGPSLVSRAVADWRFQPATESGAAVASRVLVAAIFRAPAWYNDATSAAAPVELAGRSSEIPFPTATVAPVYPPLAVADAVAIVEVMVDPHGHVSSARLVQGAPGFESAALSAARAWSFQPAQRHGQPVSAYAYLVFGFRRPVS
jgi:TonB family protein